MNQVLNAQVRRARGIASIIGFGIALAIITPHYAVAAMLSGEMSLGASGGEVSNLQTFLAADSTIYPVGLVSGYFGPSTRSAVMRFQTKNGLASVGRVGPQTLALINQQMGTGLGSGGGASFGGGAGDVSAPALGVEAITTSLPNASSINSATFMWMTNEPAYATVLYGNTWPFLLDSAPRVSGSNGLSTSQVVTVNGLQSRTQYYYVLQSRDANGNMNETLGKPFMIQ